MMEKKQLHDSCALQKHGHEVEHKCECAHQHIDCCGGQHAEHKHTCCETEHMAETHTVLAAADGEGVLTRTYLLQGLVSDLLQKLSAAACCSLLPNGWEFCRRLIMYRRFWWLI